MSKKNINAIFLISLLVASLAGCGAGGVDVQTTGSNTQLLAIAITPTNPQIAKNTSQQFTATGTYSDNTTKDLTASVTWSSSDTSVATVSTAAGTDTTTAVSSNGGGHAYAYGKNAGKTTITATSGSTSGSTTLTVTNATLVSLTVTPANPSIAAGSTQQFVATGTFSDSTTQDLTTQVTWSSSYTGVATVNASGLAASIAAGSTTITATSGSITGSTTLTTTATTTTGSATLTWDAPTTLADGTPITSTSIAGYKIYYGTSSGNYTTTIDVGNVTTYAFNNLASGTYYFAVTAYYTSGSQSGYSNEASKTVQ